MKMEVTLVTIKKNKTVKSFGELQKASFDMIISKFSDLRNLYFLI